MEFLTSMETPLQVELNRIEAEAARNSALIAGVATQWETAHLLCDTLNAAADLKPGSLFYNPLEPTAVYHDESVDVAIYSGSNGKELIQVAHDVGLRLINNGRAYEQTDTIVCLEYPGVSLYIKVEHTAGLPTTAIDLPEAA